MVWINPDGTVDRYDGDPAEERAKRVAASVTGNPTVMARGILHHLKLPWEHCRALETFLGNNLDDLVALVEDDAACASIVKNHWHAKAAFALCQSPIEETFLLRAAWDAESWSEDGLIFQWGTLKPQVPLGPYRADFLVRATGKTPVVVELDGHEFHERTKAQAGRDKSRDRFLVEAGMRVLRFTGSEVWANPTECWQQAERIARS